MKSIIKPMVLTFNTYQHVQHYVQVYFELPLDYNKMDKDILFDNYGVPVIEKALKIVKEHKHTNYYLRYNSELEDLFTTLKKDRTPQEKIGLYFGLIGMEATPGFLKDIVYNLKEK